MAFGALHSLFSRLWNRRRDGICRIQPRSVLFALSHRATSGRLLALACLIMAMSLLRRLVELAYKRVDIQPSKFLARVTATIFHRALFDDTNDMMARVQLALRRDGLCRKPRHDANLDDHNSSAGATRLESTIHCRTASMQPDLAAESAKIYPKKQRRKENRLTPQS